MTQGPEPESAPPVNAKAHIRASAENMSPSNGTAHVYVHNAQKASVSTEASTIGAPVRKAQGRVVIMTNLPERLPVLPEEMALVQGYLDDLVSAILVNDNEP